MKLHIANSVENAIKLNVQSFGQHQIEHTVNEHIAHLFGGEDGDYFTMNSMVRRDMTGREFKIVLVEDRDKVRHQVYFELINKEPSSFVRKTVIH